MAQPPGSPQNEAMTAVAARCALNLPDEAATLRVAARVADLLRAGDLVTLKGELGSGKTTFARTAIREIAGDQKLEVPSPTYTLMQSYDTLRGPVVHADLYRIGGPDELAELGWDEASDAAIVLVEWPDRLGPLLPADRLDIAMSFAGPTERRATLTGHGAWESRLTTLDLSALERP